MDDIDFANFVADAAPDLEAAESLSLIVEPVDDQFRIYHDDRFPVVDGEFAELGLENPQ
jgi:hypothetical protein